MNTITRNEFRRVITKILKATNENDVRNFSWLLLGYTRGVNDALGTTEADEINSELEVVLIDVNSVTTAKAAEDKLVAILNKIQTIGE